MIDLQYMPEGANNIESKNPANIDTKIDGIEKSVSKTEHFDILTKENVDQFMERKLYEFSNRYAELYADKLGLDKDELSESIRQKVKNNYTKVIIEDVITTGGRDEVSLTDDGKLMHNKKGDPLITARYHSNRATGESEFIFKPYADQNDPLTTKTIYHEFLHALGLTRRQEYSGAEEFSIGVQFDYNSRFINHYQPFEEGFTEIIAAEMAGVEPQSYTYEVPVCALMRKVIGDKLFLQTKNGNLDPLLSEFPYKKLEELRHILEIYQNGMENRLALIKYMNREKRSIETNSTEAIVNEYLADESYISASKNLTTFFTEYFNDKIDKVKSQKDTNDLFQVLANCQTIEKDIHAPGYYYESSFPAINQALTDSQILFVKYCQDHDLQVPGKLKELTSPESNQNREEVTIDISVSDLQLQLLDQEITDLEQKSELNTNDSILLIAKKWIHTSIETQKKYQELFPGYLNRQFAYIRQLETIQQVDADFRPKYEFSKEQHIANIPDYTYITNSNMGILNHLSLTEVFFPDKTGD